MQYRVKRILTRSAGTIAAAALLFVLTPGLALAQEPAAGQQPDDPTVGERVDEAIDTATAGPWEEGYYAMPMLGAGFGADVDGGSLLLGGAVGYDTGGPLSIEGEFGYIGGADQAPEFVASEFDTRIVSFMANALWHFDVAENWRPYGSVGIGVQNADVDIDPNDQIPGLTDDGSTELAFSFGGGFRTLLNERTGFRGDLRYVTGDEAVPSFWRTYAGLTFQLGQ